MDITPVVHRRGILAQLLYYIDLLILYSTIVQARRIDDRSPPRGYLFDGYLALIRSEV